MKEELRRFVAENYLFGDAVTFSDDDSFQQEGIIDSTGVMELVAFLEERFGIVVDDEDLVPENLDSINQLVRFISAKQQAATPPGTASAFA